MSGATLIWLAAQSAPEAAEPGLSRDPRRLGRLNLSSIIDAAKASHPAVHWLSSLALLVEQELLLTRLKDLGVMPRELALVPKRI
jgi:hypothetical protein